MSRTNLVWIPATLATIVIHLVTLGYVFAARAMRPVTRDVNHVVRPNGLEWSERR